MKLKELLEVISSMTHISIYTDMLFLDNNIVYNGEAGDLLDNELLNKKVFQILANKYTLNIILK